MENLTETVLHYLENNSSLEGWIGSSIFFNTKLTADLFDFNNTLQKDIKKMIKIAHPQLMLQYRNEYQLRIECYLSHDKVKNYKHNLSYNDIKRLVEIVGADNFYDGNYFKYIIKIYLFFYYSD